MAVRHPSKVIIRVRISLAAQTHLIDTDQVFFLPTMKLEKNKPKTVEIESNDAVSFWYCSALCQDRPRNSSNHCLQSEKTKEKELQIRYKNYNY